MAGLVKRRFVVLDLFLYPLEFFPQSNLRGLDIDPLYRPEWFGGSSHILNRSLLL